MGHIHGIHSTNIFITESLSNSRRKTKTKISNQHKIRILLVFLLYYSLLSTFPRFISHFLSAQNCLNLIEK